MSDPHNPFHNGFTVDACLGGSFVMRVFSDQVREPQRYAFTNVSDLMAFLSKASGSLVNPMQPAFDFRDHMKGEPAHGSAS